MAFSRGIIFLWNSAPCFGFLASTPLLAVPRYDYSREWLVCSSQPTTFLFVATSSPFTSTLNQTPLFFCPKYLAIWHDITSMQDIRDILRSFKKCCKLLNFNARRRNTALSSLFLNKRDTIQRNHPTSTRQTEPSITLRLNTTTTTSFPISLSWPPEQSFSQGARLSGFDQLPATSFNFCLS